MEEMQSYDSAYVTWKENGGYCKMATDVSEQEQLTSIPSLHSNANFTTDIWLKLGLTTIVQKYLIFQTSTLNSLNFQFCQPLLTNGGQPVNPEINLRIFKMKCIFLDGVKQHSKVGQNSQIVFSMVQMITLSKKQPFLPFK